MLEVAGKSSVNRRGRRLHNLPPAATCALKGVALRQPATNAELIMNPFITLIVTILDIYTWFIIATVVLSWLIGFNIINANNQFVRQVRYALHQLTEPFLKPIRRFMPDLGGLDISPVVLLLGVYFLRNLVTYYLPQIL
jgi:YggT family protein